MFLGLGLLELLVVLLPLVVLGLGVGIAVLATRRFLGSPDRGLAIAEAHTLQLVDELRDARERLGAVEDQLARLEESLSFTQALLQKRSDASPAIAATPPSPTPEV